MTSLLAEAFDKAQNLPIHLQDELAQQLIEARKALQDSLEGKTQQIGFDEL